MMRVAAGRMPTCGGKSDCRIVQVFVPVKAADELCRPAILDPPI